MKRICKTFAVLIVAVIALFSFSMTASAKEISNAQDGLVASIDSEKDSYNANEDIELTFKVTNTNDFAVENVSLEAIIPEGLTLKNQTDMKKNITSLGAGKSIEFSLIVIKEKNISTTSSMQDTSTVVTEPISSDTTEVTEPTTTNPTETQPISTETTETTSAETTSVTITETDVVQATTTKSNQSVIPNTNNDNTIIKTGTNMSYLLTGLICLVCLIVGVFAFRFKKKTVKYLSLFLCVCISVSSVAIVSVRYTLAQETTQTISFEVSKDITVDSKRYIIKNNIIYNEIINNDFENFEEVRKATIDIEKKYINSDGYIDYEDTQKLFDEITDYLQDQKEAGIIERFTRGDSSISIKMKSGINYLYVPEYKEYLSSGSKQRIITFEPAKSTYGYKFEKFYADFFIDFSSFVYDTENLDTDLIENAKLLGEETGYSYSSGDSYVDEAVTVNKLLNLPSNSLIIFEGHGNYSEDYGSVLWTDEKDDKNIIYNFDEDAIVYSKDKMIGVTHKFFENLQNDSLNNSTIFLGACCSAKDDRLANSLIDKGAENVLGYSDIVSIRYEIGLRTFLLYGLTLKHENGASYTLEEAYSYALSTYGKKDSNAPYAYLKIFQKEHSGTLSASVISSDNNPLADVRVDIYSKSDSETKFVDTIYTDNDGNFSVELQGGSYELRFNKDGYKTTSMTITISKDVMTVLKDPIVMEKEIIESSFEVANDLLYVDDKYIYSDGNAIYYKENSTDNVLTLVKQSNTGELMSNGETIYFTVSSGSSYDYVSCEVYTVMSDSTNYNKLFTSNGKVEFVTCYDNCIYYLDKTDSNTTFNKYDLHSSKNTIFKNSDLNIDNSNYIRNVSSIGQKVYLEIANENSTYGSYDIIEFDLNSTNAKVILSNSSIVSEYRNANKDKLCFSTPSDNDWYIYSADKNGNISKSAKIPSKLTLSQGVISSDGSFALMMSNMNESDFDLYKFDLDTGDITVIESGAAGFKGKGSGLGFDLEFRENIYLVGSGDRIAKFNGDGYDTYTVNGTYDPYQCWVVDGYVINRDFEWCEIG